jgi:uncharacterized membrane protein
MSILTLGMVAFAVPHFFASLAPAVRDRLKARFGEGAYKGAFALVTWIGVVAMVYAYWVSRGSGEVLFAHSGNLRHATMGLATVSMILLAASHGKSHLRLWLQSPMSIGIALWSIGHLLSVSNYAADWFWLTMLAVSVVDIVASFVRGKRPDYQPRWRSDIIAVVAGLVLTGLLVMVFHPYVLGVNIAN